MNIRKTLLVGGLLAMGLGLALAQRTPIVVAPREVTSSSTSSDSCSSGCGISPVNLGQAGNYAALGLNNADWAVAIGEIPPSPLTATTGFFGDVGVGANNTGAFQKSDLHGTWYFDPANNPPNTPDVHMGDFYVNDVVPPVWTVTDLSGANADAFAASAAASGLTPTAGTILSWGGGDIPDCPDITITGNGGVNVIQINNFVTHCNVHFVGGPNDVFIINIMADFSLNGGDMTLNGLSAPPWNGLAPCQVLWNFPNTGSQPTATISKDVGTAVGTFLAPFRDLSLVKSTVYGAFIGGRKLILQTDAALVHNSFCTNPPPTPTVTPTRTPTPIPCTTFATIPSNFQASPISQGNFIWFNSNLVVQQLQGSGVNTIFATNQTITFTANSVNYTLPIPDSTVIFDPALNGGTCPSTCATTTFDATSNSWTTHTATAGLAGNTFFGGLAYPVQVFGGLPAGINPVTWSGDFTTDSPGIKVQWKWGAAVYTPPFFSTGNYNDLGIKPVDDNNGSQYKNSDQAGTPENYRGFLIAGARGGGAGNYTGGWTGTASIFPCPAPTPTPTDTPTNTPTNTPTSTTTPTDTPTPVPPTITPTRTPTRTPSPGLTPTLPLSRYVRDR